MGIRLCLLFSAVVGFLTGNFFTFVLVFLLLLSVSNYLRTKSATKQWVELQSQSNEMMLKHDNVNNRSAFAVKNVLELQAEVQALLQRVEEVEEENQRLRSALEKGGTLEPAVLEEFLSVARKKPTLVADESSSLDKASEETASASEETAPVGLSADVSAGDSLSDPAFMDKVQVESEESGVAAEELASVESTDVSVEESGPASEEVAEFDASTGETEATEKQPDVAEPALEPGPFEQGNVDSIEVETESSVERKEEERLAELKAKKEEPSEAVKEPRQILGSKPSDESWETYIGSRLLSYVGIGILVLGLVSLLSYSLTQMGPLGRSFMGLGLGVVLLGLGFLLEPKDKYQLFGRILMGGGWSVLYFTAFGAYHIKAMKCISDPTFGTLVLAVVAGGMLLHSIRYESESTTGVALILSYATLFASPVSLYTHVAGVILGLLISFFAYRFRWLVTHIAGVVLLYSGYGTWRYFQGSRSVVTHHTEYLISGAFLVVLWVMFKVPDFAKVVEESAWKQKIIPLIGLLNLFGLAVTRKLTHHVFQTKGSPSSVLFLGVVYLVLAELIRRRGRLKVYQLDATFGVGLLFVSFWILFPLYSTTLLAWLALGAVVWLYSFARSERYFRDLGNLVTGAATLVALGGEWPKEILEFWYRIGNGEMLFDLQKTVLPSKPIGSSFSMGLMGAAGAGALFAKSWIAFLWLRKKQQERDVEEVLRDRLLIVFSTVTAMGSLYLILTPFVCALSWSILGFFLFLYGVYRKEFVIRSWSHMVLLWTIVSGDLLGLSTQHVGWSMAWGGVLLLLDGFLTFRMVQREKLSEQEEMVEKCLLIGASLSLALAASFLFATYAMVFSWLCLALLLFFYGYMRGDDAARMCSYVMHIVATLWAGVQVVSGSEMISIWGAWQASRYVLLMLLAIALSYVYAALIHRFLRERKSTDDIQREEAICVVVGNLAFVLTGWYALPKIAVALAYTLAGVLWLRLSILWKRDYLRTHSFAVVLLSGFWVFTVNLNAQGLLSGLSRRLLSLLPVLGLWAYMGAVWQQLRSQKKLTRGFSGEQVPLIFSCMGFAVVQVLIYYHAFYSGLGWVVYGLILLVLTRQLRQPRYHLFGFVAIGMAGLNFCSLGSHVVGNPWVYLQSNLALLLGPLAIFASHLWSKHFKLEEATLQRYEGQAVEATLAGFYRSGALTFGLMFCVVFLFVLTALLPARQFSLGWGVAGFLFGCYGLFGAEKYFRWIALALFGLAVGKILFVDIFRFSTGQKIVTFIGVGLSLLLVSFLYNRFKNKITELLL